MYRTAMNVEKVAQKKITEKKSLYGEDSERPAMQFVETPKVPDRPSTPDYTKCSQWMPECSAEGLPQTLSSYHQSLGFCLPGNGPHQKLQKSLIFFRLTIVDAGMAYRLSSPYQQFLAVVPVSMPSRAWSAQKKKQNPMCWV